MKKGHKLIITLVIIFFVSSCGSTINIPTKYNSSEQSHTKSKSFKVPSLSQNELHVVVKSHFVESYDNGKLKVFKIVKNHSIDSDGDGVENYLDRCPNTSKGGQVTENGCQYNDGSTVILYNDINFGFNKFEIIKDAYAVLDAISKSLKHRPELYIELQGYTDNKGCINYNKKLSLKRANAVKEYLMKTGIDERRIFSIGHGPENPVGDNNTARGRAMNRRVRTVPII